MNFYQLIFNTLVTASGFILVGVGFSLIFSTTRFFHFAHGAVFTAGAYFTFLFKSWLGLPLLTSIVLAVAMSILLGCLMELHIYRPLRHRGSSSLVLLLASLGAYIVLQNVISVVFGDDTKRIRSGVVGEGFNILGARITPVQVLTIFISIALVALLTLLLKRTKMGRVIRAVANEPELASVSGIDPNRIMLLTFAISSGLAGFAGILVALDVDMKPIMGMNMLMMGVVAAIIGGVGRIPGVVLGALLLALAQHLAVWAIGSQWQNAIGFVVLFLFLLVKPEGFFGRKIGKATV